jgi:branched-chain amino acid transport system ATP-binding protein
VSFAPPPAGLRRGEGRALGGVNAPTLEVSNVDAGYGVSRVLEAVSCRVEPGEVVAVLGTNGSGKSTLLKTIMGLATLYGGTIRWDHESIQRLETHDRVRRGLGYVPQTENVFTDLTVAENLRLGGYLLSRTQLRDRLDAVYELFPFLRGRAAALGGYLSGGERRLLSIACCLVTRPRLLLLDEPSADLAPAAIDLVFSKILEINRALSIPVLLVEQNVRRALGIAGRVYILARGRNRLAVARGELDERRCAEIFLEGAVPHNRTEEA